MTEYALLISPSVNRVYADASVRLTRAELAVFGDAGLGGRITEIAEARIGGVPYVTFQADGLTARDIAFLSNLSSLYALFERADDLLRPLAVTPLDRFDSDLLTIQKYVGKTNEQFTRLLLNVTILATADPAAMLDRRLRVLDPMCGRGTTLNQALMYGYHAAGIDVDGKDFDAYATFLRTWLKNKRLKHTAELAPIRRDRAHVGRRLHVALGESKEAYKAGDVLDVTVIHGDTRRAREFYKPRTFDVVVADAPYGVQHGSHADGRLARGPLPLLAEALPGWVELLRPGGALGVSWNTYGGDRDTLAALLADHGLQPVDTEAHRAFAHRVDQAITRDLLVASRPR